MRGVDGTEYTVSMKTILVDAINGLIRKDGSIVEPMYELLESYPNAKIALTGANDEQFRQFKLDRSPYEVFTLKHDPEKPIRDILPPCSKPTT